MISSYFIQGLISLTPDHEELLIVTQDSPQELLGSLSLIPVGCSANACGLNYPRNKIMSQIETVFEHLVTIIEADCEGYRAVAIYS